MSTPGDDAGPSTSGQFGDRAPASAEDVTSSLLTDDVTGAAGTEAGTEAVSEADVGKERITKSHSVHIRDPPVSETRCQPPGTTSQPTVVLMEEKHGPLYRAIPSMPFPLAIIACILNIILPGSGTLLSAFSVCCCATTRINNKLVAFLLNLVSALLQFVTFLPIVGWVWSITWGMAFVQLAAESSTRRKHHRQHQHLTGSQVPYYVRRHSSVEYSRSQQ